jgi:CBS domain-containing protein/gamma-glutamylcysteine synthetase
METTRSHKEVEAKKDAEKHRDYMVALLQDLHALERMLADGLFETGNRRIGAEQEMFLVNQAWAPANGALAMLDALKDPHFTTELGAFQLEANCDPQLFSGDGISQMHAQLDALMDKARGAARSLDMHAVLMGILPTLRKKDLGLDSMVPSPRYLTLNRIVTDLRGGRFDLSIKGLDELIIDHDSVMLEACNSSFQIHYQVAPEEFARLYNIAQLMAGPIMSIACNSPIVFGRRLWAETRIALFRQAVDTRSPSKQGRETEARVSFGTRWVKRSIAEIYREDIARFRSLVGTDLDEDPMAVLERGELPQLKALRLHNGTIYRWNRPCFGFANGKAHLRIENRVMPSGPSVLDEMASAAFWFGLMAEWGATADDVSQRMDFDQAGYNFYTAAREGLGAHFLWFDGEEISAQRLILDRLLPQAEAGLRRQRIDDADITKYLGVVEARARTGRTGARWQFSSWNSLRDRATPAERATALVAATVQRQLTGRPVSEWERARLDETSGAHRNYERVEQYMRTDLFTVEAEDPIEVVTHLLIWERLRYVPVEDKEHRLCGLVTHRAVLRHLSDERRQPRTPTSTIMRSDLITVTPDTSTLDAIRLMRRHKIGCLPVVNDGRLVGLVTEDDFMDVAEKLLAEFAPKALDPA